MVTFDELLTGQVNKDETVAIIFNKIKVILLLFLVLLGVEPRS
jgi:hypothetical protein